MAAEIQATQQSISQYQDDYVMVNSGDATNEATDCEPDEDMKDVEFEYVFRPNPIRDFDGVGGKGVAAIWYVFLSTSSSSKNAYDRLQKQVGEIKNEWMV